MAAAPAPHRCCSKAFGTARGFVFFTALREPQRPHEISCPPGAEQLLFPWYGVAKRPRLRILGPGPSWIRRSTELTQPISLSASVLEKPAGGLDVAQKHRDRLARISKAKLEAMKTPLLQDGLRCHCRPAWGGLRVAPFEFRVSGRGDRNRLHDRFRYRPPGDQRGSAAVRMFAWCSSGWRLHRGPAGLDSPGSLRFCGQHLAQNL